VFSEIPGRGGPGPVPDETLRASSVSTGRRLGPPGPHESSVSPRLGRELLSIGVEADLVSPDRERLLVIAGRTVTVEEDRDRSGRAVTDAWSEYEARDRDFERSASHPARASQVDVAHSQISPGLTPVA
jgi:hypothetical protein